MLSWLTVGFLIQNKQTIHTAGCMQMNIVREVGQVAEFRSGLVVETTNGQTVAQFTMAKSLVRPHAFEQIPTTKLVCKLSSSKNP